MFMCTSQREIGEGNLQRTGDQRPDLLPMAARVGRDDHRVHAENLKKLEKVNQRLRRAVLDPTLDNLILKEAAKGDF